MDEKKIVIEPGTSLLVLGNIGLKGTKIMAYEGENKLSTRYNPDFIKKAALLYDEADGSEDLLKLLEDNPYKIVSEGGIFRALWDISVEYKIGFDVDIFDIPVRQETIELSNYFDVNPYEMVSEKCVLALVRGGRTIVNALKETEIPCAIIGEVTAGNDKIVRHQDGALHLRPAKRDSIESFMNRKEELS